MNHNTTPQLKTPQTPIKCTKPIECEKCAHYIFNCKGRKP